MHRHRHYLLATTASVMGIGAFNATDKTINSVLRTDGRFYRIPRYQRGYAWKKNQWEMLWNDLINEEMGMFLGSLLLCSTNDGDTWEIVDGQQRSLTLTILLSVLRNRLDKMNLGAQAQIVQMLISDHSGFGEEETSRVIPSDDISDFFETNIQQYPQNPDPKTAESAEEKRVASAKRFFEKRLEDYLKDGWPLDQQYVGMKGLIQRVEKLTVVCIEVHDESDAYKVFESVNAKGAELTVADILKNMIFRELKPKPGVEDYAQNQWREIIANLDDSGISLARFIRYCWMSEYEFVQEKELYHAIHRRMKGKNSTEWKDLIDKLVQNSLYVKEIYDPNLANMEIFGPDKRRIVSSLSAISAMNITQIVPLLLAIRNNIGVKKSWKKWFEVLEKFCYQYHAVSKGSPNRVETQYSRFARKIHDISKQAPSTERSRDLDRAWGEFSNKLKDLKPERDQFIESFASNIQYSSNSQKKSVLRYTLNAINDFMQDGTGELIVDNQYTNIEHVLPQKPSKWGYSEEEVNPFVNQIGNLVIVSKKINSSIGNAPLEEKLPDLMKSELAIVEDFLTDSRTGKWDETAINKRSRKLATIAYDKIWVF
jgi:hypothetical protein